MTIQTEAVIAEIAEMKACLSALHVELEGLRSGTTDADARIWAIETEIENMYARLEQLGLPLSTIK